MSLDSADFTKDERKQLEEFQRLTELFKFYLELIFKAFTFVLGIAGAVSAFVLGKDVSDRHLAALGLFLPFLLCVGMGVAFLRAVDSTRDLSKALTDLKDLLGLRLAPHSINLMKALQGFGWTLIACGAGILLFALLYFVSSGSPHKEVRAQGSANFQFGQQSTFFRHYCAVRPWYLSLQ